MTPAGTAGIRGRAPIAGQTQALFWEKGLDLRILEQLSSAAERS